MPEFLGILQIAYLYKLPVTYTSIYILLQVLYGCKVIGAFWWGVPEENFDGSFKQSFVLNYSKYTNLSTDNTTLVSVTPEVLHKRWEKVIEICHRKGQISGKTFELAGIRSHGLSFCAVQKAGCTMWIRLSKYFEGQNYNTGNPMTLNKRMIHLQAPSLYKQFKDNQNDRLFIQHSLRAMTVRDPYSRLWSAYIDKFVLVDFWHTKGKHIVSMVRKNATSKALKCGHDVTFSEFIEYVLNIGHDFKYLDQDKHWLPASDICDPCVFKPHVIGKQESFKDDLIQTLKLVHLDDLIENLTSVDSTEFEIKEEIDYNIWRYPSFNQCITKCELGERIWRAFQYNGYLPLELNFPMETCAESTKSVETFYKLVSDIRKEYNMTSEIKKVNRRKKITEAYQQISDENMEKLKRLYQMDFEMFGYEANPDFTRRSNILK
ncbi:Carbohydrate sulfotransferase 14 [Mactra antiquata]